MAKFFSSRKSKGAINQEQIGISEGHPALDIVEPTYYQNERRSNRKRLIKKFMGKTRNLFRGDVVIDSSRTCQPLIIPALPETSVDLQSEIDEELQFLSERNTCSTANSSSPNRSGQKTLLTLETRSELADLGTDFTPPSTASDGSLASGGLQPCYTCRRNAGHNSQRSDQLHDEAQAVEVTEDSGSRPLPNNSAGESSSQREATEPSVLDLIRRTWSSARIRLPPNGGTPQSGPSSAADTTTDEAPSSSWMDDVVDQDVRQVLLAGRASMVSNVYNIIDPLNGLKHSQSLKVRKDTCGAYRRDRPVSWHNTLLSADFSNVSFFDKRLSDDSGSICISNLFVAPVFSGTAEARASLREADEAAVKAETVAGDFVCLAQPQAEIDTIRRRRSGFSKFLEAALTAQKGELDAKFMAELAEQKRNLEAAEEERYDSTAKLYEIDILNLQDDHEAEVKDLKEVVKDLRARLGTREKAFRSSKREVTSLTEKCTASERQLQDKSSQCDQVLQAFHERESTLQRQTEDIRDLRRELARTRDQYERSMRAAQEEDHAVRRAHRDLADRYQGLLTGFNQLNGNRQATEAQLQQVFVALGEQARDFDSLKARYDFVVAEKSRDMNMHMAHNQNPSAMKPLHREDELAEATKPLRQELNEKDEVNAELHRQLEATQATNKARVKKLKRVIARQSQEIVIDEMALSIAQVQRDHWHELYVELAEAGTSKLAFSSHARNLAECHLRLQEARFELESQVLEAKLRGDRALLDVAIRKQHEAVKLEKRDATIAHLTRSVEIMKVKFEHENGMALMYKDVIDKEIPYLRQRNDEVERMLDDQVTNNVGANHGAVFHDQQRRLKQLEAAEKWWEQQVNHQIQEYESLKSDYGFFWTTTSYDLTSARSWRNERDQLEVENVTLRERFAHELLLEPLVIPAHRKTRQQIDDEFKLENVDELLLKEFNHCYGAVPKVIMGIDAAPWEQLRVELKDDIAEQKRRWIAQRDEEIAKFKDRVTELPNDHEWIDDSEEFEASWKGKGRVAGEGVAAGA